LRLNGYAVKRLLGDDLLGTSQSSVDMTADILATDHLY
jgi:hypothetical protein